MNSEFIDIGTNHQDFFLENFQWRNYYHLQFSLFSLIWERENYYYVFESLNTPVLVYQVDSFLLKHLTHKTMEKHNVIQ